jgi:Kef-type K+ transport system membrane component KefB
VTTELYVAMILAVAAVAASMISIEIGISVAIIEIALGVVLGNTLHLAAPDWLTFLAGFGSVILTFNAGTEIDPDRLRRTWKASLLIGGVSFAAPFVCALLTCRYGLGWTWRAAEIGGIALSTTSVAVIWAVTVETGLARTALGQLIISATFITDLGTVLALSVLFVTPSWWLVPFIAVSLTLIVVMRALEGWYFDRYGDRVIEAELKGAFAALLVLMWLGQRAQAEAVLPAFVLGFALAPVLARHPKLRSRFRIVSFALLTPFFFLRAGLNVSLSLVLTNLGIVGLLLALKLIAKTSTMYPLARRYAGGSAWPVALLMSTGLTFGTIASQTGLALGVINRAQFSVLVCVVVLSAIVPTALAQRILQSQSATRPHPAAQEAAQPSPYAPDTEDDDEVPHQRRGQHPDQPPAYPRLPASINPPEAGEARATTSQLDDQ